MNVRELKRILLRYKVDDKVTIGEGWIKVEGKFNSGDAYEEYINSSGGTWSDGCGTAPNGKFCGECATFNCDKCGWEKRG